jgi:hypothetical protein
MGEVMHTYINTGVFESVTDRQLRAAQLVKKFTAFNGTRKSVTMFTKACNYTLPSAK